MKAAGWIDVLFDFGVSTFSPVGTRISKVSQLAGLTTNPFFPKGKRHRSYITFFIQGRPRRASMTPGTPTLTWYSDKFRPINFPLQNYCIKHSKHYATEDAFRKHTTKCHGMKLEKKRPGPPSTVSAKRQRHTKWENSKKYAPTDKARKTIQRRDAAASKMFMELLVIGEFKRQRAYLKLLDAVEVAIERIEFHCTIQEYQSKFGSSWKYCVYSLCAAEGRTVLDSTKNQFFDNIFMQEAEKEKQRRNTNSSLCPRSWIAFRWVGNPFLLRSSHSDESIINLGTITDDEDEERGLFKKNVPRPDEWRSLLENDLEPVLLRIESTGNKKLRGRRYEEEEEDVGEETAHSSSEGGSGHSSVSEDDQHEVEYEDF
ncbi:hypothetical protein BDB00DRAFT_879018 [Zychaea mexicana]|uniref:uncharacterized protein n=1 Tax=Zychaea mexicana TaxID=64656 RepID=UPI0022FDCF8B|nr:uncharacterized protein BDB00DRAFT_879018 [Zychaea mexicana]KAI9484288.1 hypothetical protein BDB00DRAFT_879018 [Zychaea mexicana]